MSAPLEGGFTAEHLTDPWVLSSSSTLLVPGLLRGLESVVVALVSREGTLRDANRGFLLLISNSASTPEAGGVAGLFLDPRFDELLEQRVDPFEGTLYRGLLRLGCPGGKPTALTGAVYGVDDELLVVAEHDVSVLGSLRAAMLEMSHDLDSKQRQITRLEHEVERLGELADAAMRDRDTLLDALAGRESGAGER